MKEKMIKLAVLSIVCLSCLFFAQAEKVNASIIPPRITSGNYTYERVDRLVGEKNEIRIIHVSNVGKRLVIPSYIDGKKVVDIGPNDIYYSEPEYYTAKEWPICSETERNKVEEVVIPDTVTRLSNSCFEGFSNLKKVKLSKNMETIAGGAFSNCTNLSKINLSGNKLDTIESHAFEYTKKLKQVVLGKHIHRLESYAFWESGIESVTMPTNGGLSCENVFWNCKKLKTVKFRNAPVHLKISSNSFVLTSVKKLIIPPRVKSFTYPLGKLLDEIVIKGKKTRLYEEREVDGDDQKFKGKKFFFMLTKKLTVPKGSRAYKDAKRPMRLKKSLWYREGRFALPKSWLRNVKVKVR